MITYNEGNFIRCHLKQLMTQDRVSEDIIKQIPEEVLNILLQNNGQV